MQEIHCLNDQQGQNYFSRTVLNTDPVLQRSVRLVRSETDTVGSYLYNLFNQNASEQGHYLQDGEWVSVDRTADVPFNAYRLGLAQAHALGYIDHAHEDMEFEPSSDEESSDDEAMAEEQTAADEDEEENTSALSEIGALGDDEIPSFSRW